MTNTITNHGRDTWIITVLRTMFTILYAIAPPIAGRAALALITRPRRRHYQTLPDILHEAELLTIPFQKHRLAGYSWGAGPTILLVHGWESRGLRFAALIPGLVAQGYRVLAVDAPAHGNSSGRHTDLLEISAAVRSILDREPVYAIIAHSFGAAATLWAVAEEKSTRVSKLICVGAPTELTLMIHEFTTLLKFSEALTQKVIRTFERHFGQHPTYYSIARVARHLQINGLIIHDHEDKRVPYDHALVLAGAWRSAQLISTTGLGHNKPLEDPMVIQAIQAFLAQ